ncbi:hypothetical protein DFP72DRAFT_933207 [Ephemerocybe angulata]|uniref:Uncharacterized protein n=1 Tax=Ephemerocybe angulata TaxID=980116 RepID=A0A8H6HCX6_9AGAR|nr:hypothetical protein DFP72DRAFT_933207 [Tulosesus angulatus]
MDKLELTQLEWSSPLRRNDKGMNLAPIPNEIYAEILDLLHPEGDGTLSEPPEVLANLSLTCRYLCFLALPRLYSSMKMAGPSYTRKRGPEYSKFYTAVTQNSGDGRALAQYVRSAHLLDYSDSMGKPAHRALSATLYLPAIGFMENLARVTITNAEIARPFFQALTGLKRLESLKLIQFLIYGSCKEDFSILSSLRLSSLELSPIPFIAQVTLIETMPEEYGLLALAFDYACLAKLSTAIRGSIQKLETCSEQLPLHTLEITSSDFRLTRSSVKCLQDLRRLVFTTGAQDALKGVQLEPSDLPNLTEVVCTPPQLDVLARGRRLTDITLHWEWANSPRIPTLFKTLSESVAASLKHLKMPAEWLISSSLLPSDPLPNLEHLTLCESGNALEERESVSYQLCSSVLRKLLTRETVHKSDFTKCWCGGTVVTPSQEHPRRL